MSSTTTELLDDLSSLGVDPKTRHSFASALRSEYLHHKGPAVGRYFDRVNLSPRLLVLMEKLEERVRKSRDVEKLIELIAGDGSLTDGKTTRKTTNIRRPKKLVPTSRRAATVEEYLSLNFARVDSSSIFDGFCVAHAGRGEDDQVFDTAMERFRTMLLERDRPKNVALCQSLADNLCFCIGPKRFLEKHTRVIETQFDRYVMTMCTDIWPHNPDWNGSFDYSSEKPILTTSMWRPDDHCAVWEETFHTVTEAMNRLSVNDDYPAFRNWGFKKASPLGRLMQADIDTGSYETKRQNRKERGLYDFETAVNEWVHQIWAIWLAGHEYRLSRAQLRALDIMKDTPGMPDR